MAKAEVFLNVDIANISRNVAGTTMIVSGTQMVGLKHVTDQAGAPTVDDDSDSGFASSSTWRTAYGDMYMCRSPSPGAAVWDRLLTSADGGTLP